jgi:hypothetical protein
MKMQFAGILVLAAVAGVIYLVFFGYEEGRAPPLAAGDDEAAKIRHAREQLLAIAGVVAEAQRRRGPVGAITGSRCSDCACRGADLRGADYTNSCMAAWVTILGRLEEAAARRAEAGAMRRDPWGSPFALDENQGEMGDCTAKDRLRSVGADGLWGTADDIIMDLPLSPKCP